MSLKVLLADESPTIRKAFEIALKDYGVKIQSVHQGIDVKELCESFMPHICFLDVLLPKLNGYDASAQLKSDPKLGKIPTVIMWSGFMELDEDKFMTAGASGKIEKPFESSELRELIQKLVPSLASNEISRHIIPDNIPQDGVFENQPEGHSATPGVPPAVPGATDLNLDNLESDVEDFSIENLGDPSSESNAAASGFEGLDDLDDFKIETLDDDSFPVDAKSGEDFDDIFGNVDSVPTNDSKDDDIFGSLENEVGGSVSASGDDIFGVSTNAPISATPPPPPLETQEPPSLEALEPLNDDVPLPPPVSMTESPSGVSNDNFNLSVVEDEPAVTNPGVPPVEEKKQNEPTADAGLFLEPNSEGIPQLSKEELKRLILAQSKDIIESVVWDVVPELARELIQKEITKLMGKAESENLDGDLR